ncbi:MAG: hypothetical protein WCT18_00170 [Patescibacteria group bacterium]
MEKIKKTIFAIVQPIIGLSFILTMILFLLEIWRPGFVSLYFSVEIVYLIFLFSGFGFIFNDCFSPT